MSKRDIGLPEIAFSAAEKRFNIAIELAPYFTSLTENLGCTRTQQRKIEETTPLFEQAARQDQALTAVGRR
ncbi:MAG: hypothetical protein OSB26_16045 [Woeseiaceae bacterium]|jgi:hypothetical protein|nr:hypothetical protein [Woeseiaceae bacterium]